MTADSSTFGGFTGGLLMAIRDEGLKAPILNFSVLGKDTPRSIDNFDEDVSIVCNILELYLLTIPSEEGSHLCYRRCLLSAQLERVLIHEYTAPKSN
jgi:hypothetical protein